MAIPQSFQIQLAGVTYGFVVRWNPASSCWILDIYDSDDVLILGGVPIVTGANLLAQYDYLGFGGALVAQTENDPNAVPTFDSFGSTAQLYFVTPPS